MLKTIVNRGWYPALITALAVAGLIYKWPLEAMVPALIIILGIGLVVTIIRAREKQLESVSLRLRQLAAYFNRRFMGNSSLSIFAVIDTLFGIDDPKVWDWARACDMSQRVFNTWCSSFVARVESDIRSRQLADCLGIYLNEFWSITSHYYEFIDQFYELAEKIEVPADTIDQYNKFTMEYNAFVQDFRDNLSELRKVVKTGIEPPSVKLAQELRLVK